MARTILFSKLSSWTDLCVYYNYIYKLYFRQTLQSFNESRHVDWDSVIHYISDEERSDVESELSAISEESTSSASTCVDAEESPLGGVRFSV